MLGVLTSSTKEAPCESMQGSSSWESICTVDGVIVRTTEAGDPLESVRIINDVESLVG